MPKLGLFYRGQVDDEDIFTTVYDGTRWAGDTNIASQRGGISPRTWDPPAACLHNNRLCLVYATRGDGDLYMSLYDGSTWYGNEKIGSIEGEVSPSSVRGPALITYNNTLYLIYISGGADHALRWSRFDGRRWQGDEAIVTVAGSTLKSNRSPAAVVFNDKLYLIYRGASVTSDKLYIAWFDGQSWNGDTSIGDQPGGVDPWSDEAPTAAVFNDKLVLVYKGATVPNLYISRFDGSSWSGDVELSDEPGGLDAKSDAGPRVLVFENKLWLIYCGHRNRSFFVSCFDGATWSGDVAVSNQAGNVDPESDAGPALSLMPFPNPVVNVRDVPQGRVMDMRTKPMPAAVYHAEKTGMVMVKTGPEAVTAPGLGGDQPSPILDPLISDISLMGTHDSAAINPWLRTFYACHNMTVTEQLTAGVRVLDVRLKVKKSGSAFAFGTCHGAIGLGFAANEYQSFESLLDECKAFLSRQRTEFLVMSLKIDDWNGFDSGRDGPAVFDALRALLQDYPVITNKSAIPHLSEAMGKIYLLNRINGELSLGVPIGWPDNTNGTWLPRTSDREFDVYVQDRYKGLPVIAGPEKFRLFVDAVGQSRQRGQMLINFGSATYFGVGGINIHRGLLRHLGVTANRPSFFGWSLFDYVDLAYPTSVYPALTCTQMINAATSNYRDFPSGYVVYTDGRNEQL
ncbi:hypothetical protein B6S44_23865 [Bosea sp. Tri-44]|uniref:hypothetical protein n=1 Tax=Bosea sp. Tri-44 TaxID=1972137 RepID=UPI00100F394B|nr:hypothetical protein [Bosea sp. Tri-44]RXT48110.1 hypothetical protein B6S44_23865 [Bosea sp. Tri-44]